jgi:formate dehydrogenase subunit beta
MSKYAKLEVKDGNFQDALRGFLRALLEKETVYAAMVPMRLPYKKNVMQTVIHDPEMIKDADPLAPSMPLSAAKPLSQLTYKNSGKKLAAVLRPCEVRAFIELVKLKQGSMDDLLLISFDCLGRYETNDYLKLVESDDNYTATFYKEAAESTARNGFDVADACKVCEFPVPENVDINICVVGGDLEKEIILEALSDQGEKALDELNLPGAEPPAGRREAVDSLVKTRIETRDAMFAEYREKTSDLGKLAEVLGSCINCYNCRVACPVCYCRECVFVTDTFRHEPDQYMTWANKRGAVKMPTDTLFYHLTRMAHMSTLCVGCGQCSSACPNDIPVMNIFRTVADKTQARFNYQPGKDPGEPLPLATFQDVEFEELTSESEADRG